MVKSWLIQAHFVNALLENHVSFPIDDHSLAVEEEVPLEGVVGEIADVALGVCLKPPSKFDFFFVFRKFSVLIEALVNVDYAILFWHARVKIWVMTVIIDIPDVAVQVLPNLTEVSVFRWLRGPVDAHQKIISLLSNVVDVYPVVIIIVGCVLDVS